MVTGSFAVRADLKQYILVEGTHSLIKDTSGVLTEGLAHDLL